MEWLLARLAGARRLVIEQPVFLAPVMLDERLLRQIGTPTPDV
jgi:hypothetical protein